MGWWRWIALIAVFAVTLGVIQTGVGRSLLQRAGLIAASVDYTALSFDEPQALPTQLPSSRTTVPTAFMIHNVSGEERTYRWFIDVTHSGRSQRIRTGTLDLPAESQQVVRENLALTCPSGRLKVTVSLASPAESIAYWANCLPSKRETLHAYAADTPRAGLCRWLEWSRTIR